MLVLPLSKLRYFKYQTIAIACIFFIAPLIAQSEQCAAPELHPSGSHYELTKRIESPLVPAIENIDESMPTFTELENMSLLTKDSDAMKQFEALPSPPSEMAPLIMIHPNTDRRKLHAVEIAAISSSDCVPDYVEYWGYRVVCSESHLVKNPFAGNYVFRYYKTIDGQITEVVRKSFTVTNESFLPIHQKTLNTDGFRDESKKLIARGLIVDVSAEGIVPDPDQPSYISIQYTPTEHTSSTHGKADKFIYLPFSQAALDHSSSDPKDTDHIRFKIGTNLVKQPVHSSSSGIAHFAAGYTLSSEANLSEAHKISTCSELKALSGSLYTSIQLEGDIACNPDDEFTPIQMASTFTFNGMNHEISGITIASNDNDLGLFSILPEGTAVANLRLRNINISGASRIGSLAGMTLRNVTIANIDVTDSHILGDLYLGGLIGMTQQGANIENILTSVDIEGDGVIGGAFGYLNASTASNISVSAYLKGSYNLGEITGGSRNSTISNVNPLVSMSILPAEETIPGDYDRNGIVERADYDVWRMQFGVTVSPPGFGGDGNGDGKVDLADYGVWRNNLGATM